MTATLSGPMLPPRSGGPARQLMVLLHGYGADGADLIGLGYQWRDLFPEMAFVAPNAPARCERNPAGYQWFALDLENPAYRLAGADTMRPVIVNFLIDLWSQTGLSARDTVLCGFSQGAMMALHVGCSLDESLAGIVSFSGAWIEPEGFAAGRFAKPAVVLIHGEVDPVVPPQSSAIAEAALRGAGFEVSLHWEAGAGHTIAPEGLAVATEFLGRVLPKP